jgi:hypothetical protein
MEAVNSRDHHRCIVENEKALPSRRLLRFRLLRWQSLQACTRHRWLGSTGSPET